MISPLRFVFSLALLAIPAELYYASFYAPLFSDSSLSEIGFFYLIALGVFPLYGTAALTAALYPLLKLLKNRHPVYVKAAAFIISFLLLLILAIDAHVFYLYRFHLSVAMLELFFNGQIISFSSSMKLSITIEAVLLCCYVLLMVFLALRLVSFKKFKSYFLLVPSCLLFLGVNIMHAAATAHADVALTSLAARIPLYYPLTANTFLLRHGFITEEDMTVDKANIQSQGIFDYPKEPLSYASDVKPKNILFIIVDSLRSDMLTPEVMPNLYAFSQGNWRFLNHHSGGNCTRFGVFTLFYGIPGSYWNAARSSGTKAALISACEKFNFEIKTFTSAPLYKPEFHQTVFAGVDNLRMTSEGNTVLLRDKNCIDDFERYLDARTKERFFSLVFLDNVHEYSFDKNQEKIFTPTEQSFNYMELSPSTNIEPYRNLAKNASYAADKNLGRIFGILKERKLLEDTIVIVTADHGDELNDNGLNYWGHNSNFSSAQTKVPLVVSWPGRQGEEIKKLSTAYDVSTTLLKHAFGVENQIRDYAMGEDLFSLDKRKYFWVSSYTENAIVSEKCIGVFDVLGFLSWRDQSYRKMSQGCEGIDYWQALQDLNFYLKR